MFNLFKKYSITILNNNWEVLRETANFKFIPRMHELIYLKEYNKYFRVCNVVYSFEKGQGIFIIVEEYRDDFAIIEKRKK